MALQAKNYDPAIMNGANLDITLDLGDITDANGNTNIEIDAVTSAVNYVRSSNAATGSGPTLSAQGSDTNIDVNLTPKGTGNVVSSVGGFEEASEIVTTASPALTVYGSSVIDSSSNAVNGSLGSGTFIGQIKTIVMTDASNSSTISITNHQTSDPEVATFDAADEAGVFLWTGTEWITVFATCTFV